MIEKADDIYLVHSTRPMLIVAVIDDDAACAGSELLRVGLLLRSAASIAAPGRVDGGDFHTVGTVLISLQICNAHVPINQFSVA